MAKLIVIHGPTGVGKSTMAARLRDELEGPVALVSQDAIYHDMLGGNGDPSKFEAIKVIKAVVSQLAIDDYQIILEGLLRADRYRSVFQVVKDNIETKFVYLSAHPDTTSLRHSTRPIANMFGEDKVREWYALSEPYGFDSETIIETDGLSENETWMQVKDFLKLN